MAYTVGHGIIAAALGVIALAGFGVALVIQAVR